MLLLTLMLACSSSQPIFTPLPGGITNGHASETPTWSVVLDGRGPVPLGVVAESVDVTLSAETASGATIRSTSSTHQHRAATLRLAEVGSYVIRVSAVSGERAPFALLRRAQMSGDSCSQLDQLLADSWSLPGIDHPSDDPAHRTRSLVAVMPWADECTVNRLGDLDLGPSCTRSGLDQAEGAALFEVVAREFRDCHSGWDQMDESDGPRREWVVQRGTSLRFARLQQVEGLAWQVSVGAMPES